MDNARIYVDFNEMVTHNVVLLSKDDTRIDSQGNIIAFYEGMPVSIYEDDICDGEVDNLIAEGIAIKYDLSSYPYWQHVKWCCRIDLNGIIHESDLRNGGTMRKETLDNLEKFNKVCSENLASAIEEILKAGIDKKVPAIGFITTDDFYGFYLTWDYHNSNIEEYYDWEQGLYPDFLYTPLVEAVDACEEIDLTTKSDEKWGFAKALLTILEENIKQIPDEIFHKHNYRREDILFFATMSDGDYMEEMLDTSVKMFNTLETIEAHGLLQ